MTQSLFSKTIKFHFEAPKLVSDDDINTFKIVSSIRNSVSSLYYFQVLLIAWVLLIVNACIDITMKPAVQTGTEYAEDDTRVPSEKSSIEY